MFFDTIARQRANLILQDFAADFLDRADRQTSQLERSVRRAD